MGIIFSSCNNNDRTDAQKPLFEIKNNVSIPSFNSDSAYGFIETQVSFGPRNPGSAGHRKALEFFNSELNKNADTVILQEFTYPGYDNEILNLTNIIAKFNPNAANRIFISAHWDSRPWADHDKDEAKRNLPILGANDGGSGVGVILEIARILKDNPVSFGVDLILWDGEDYGKEHDIMNFCLGSKYFASKSSNTYNPVFGILLDLVGDKAAVFPKEGNSIMYASDIVNLVWSIANKQNAASFSNTESQPIYDDHVPLNQAGIKTIDIIDVSLIGADSPDERRNYWHTHNDTMENISKTTLGQVGNVLTELIYTLQFNESKPL